MEQKDEKKLKEEHPKTEKNSVPSLKERIENLQEKNEFLDNPMKENVVKPEEELSKKEKK